MQHQCTAEAQRSSYKETGKHLVLHEFLGAEQGHEMQMLLEKVITHSCKAGTWLTPPLPTLHCSSVAVG